MTALASGSLSRNYAFSSSQNNGKILSENDPVSGETVTYTYDTLNRLASATSSDNPGWGQSFGKRTGVSPLCAYAMMDSGTSPP